MLRYKGYTGVFEYDDEAKIFHGDVYMQRDVVTFQSDTSEGMKKEFRESIDDYLKWCK
jgi:predicted HicB family RNase H-like nuclease